MEFKKELRLNQYIEILKKMSSVEIFDEYKEFTKLIKVIDHFIKRVSFIFVNLAKEVRTFYEKDNYLNNLDSFTYKIVQKYYLKVDNLYSQLKILEFEILLNTHLYSVNDCVYNFTSKPQIIKDIKRLYSLYFKKGERFDKVVGRLFIFKEICLSVLRSLNIDYPVNEPTILKIYVENLVNKNDELIKSNKLPKDTYLLDLMILCSDLNTF